MYCNAIHTNQCIHTYIHTRNVELAKCIGRWWQQNILAPGYTECFEGQSVTLYVQVVVTTHMGTYIATGRQCMWNAKKNSTAVWTHERLQSHWGTIAVKTSISDLWQECHSHESKHRVSIVCLHRPYVEHNCTHRYAKDVGTDAIAI